MRNLFTTVLILKINIAASCKIIDQLKRKVRKIKLVINFLTFYSTYVWMDSHMRYNFSYENAQKIFIYYVNDPVLTQ